jgi:hypothetical protein
MGQALQLEKTLYLLPPGPQVRLTNWYVVGPFGKETVTLKTPVSVNPSTHPVVPAAPATQRSRVRTLGSTRSFSAGPSPLCVLSRYGGCGKP